MFSLANQNLENQDPQDRDGPSFLVFVLASEEELTRKLGPSRFSRTVPLFEIEETRTVPLFEIGEGEMSDAASGAGRARTLRRVAALAALGVLVGAGLYLRAALDIEWSVPVVRQMVVDLGFWGPALYLVLFAFRWAFLVPSQVMLVVGGACFGFGAGTLYGAIGTTMSGLFIFLVTRFLVGDSLRERAPRRLGRALEAAGKRGGALLVAAGTGYPVGPMTAFQVGAGLTSMPLLLYAPALVAGALVRAGLYAYLGNSLVEVGLLASWPALVLLGLLCVPFLIPRVRARLVRWL